MQPQAGDKTLLREWSGVVASWSALELVVTVAEATAGAAWSAHWARATIATLSTLGQGRSSAVAVLQLTMEHMS